MQNLSAWTMLIKTLWFLRIPAYPRVERSSRLLLGPWAQPGCSQWWHLKHKTSSSLTWRSCCASAQKSPGLWRGEALWTSHCLWRRPRFTSQTSTKISLTSFFGVRIAARGGSKISRPVAPQTERRPLHLLCLYLHLRHPQWFPLTSE